MNAEKYQNDDQLPGNNNFYVPALYIYLISSPLYAHGGYEAFVPLLAHMFILLPLLAINIILILLNLKFKKKWVHITVTVLLSIGAVLSAITIVYGFSRELLLSLLLAFFSVVIHAALVFFSRWVYLRGPVRS